MISPVPPTSGLLTCLPGTNRVSFILVGRTDSSYSEVVTYVSQLGHIQKPLCSVSPPWYWPQLQYNRTTKTHCIDIVGVQHYINGLSGMLGVPSSIQGYCHTLHILLQLCVMTTYISINPFSVPCMRMFTLRSCPWRNWRKLSLTNSWPSLLHPLMRQW